MPNLSPEDFGERFWPYHSTEDEWEEDWTEAIGADCTAKWISPDHYLELEIPIKSEPVELSYLIVSCDAAVIAISEDLRRSLIIVDGGRADGETFREVASYDLSKEERQAAGNVETVRKENRARVFEEAVVWVQKQMKQMAADFVLTG